MEITLTALVPVLVLLVSIVSVFFIIKRNFSKKIVGNDINKKGEPIVAESGGIALLLPFWIAIISFQLLFGINLNVIAAGIASTIFCIIGFLDDNKHKFLSKPLSWKQRAVPIAITSLIIAGILFVPKGIFDISGIIIVAIFSLFFAGLASFSNTFEGLNGWTTGSSFIITAILAIVSGIISQELSFLFICLNATILGLFLFNKYPAKTFPGDSGTLLIGSAIAGITLFSQNIMFVAYVFALFIPHMIDFFLLKMITNKDDATQRKFRPYKLLPNGKLTIPDYPDKKTRYDFAKLVMKIFGPLKEWQIVAIIWVIVLVNAVIWSTIFMYFNLIN